MDKIDKKIITLLQQNARMPLKALAENLRRKRLLKDMKLRLIS